MILESRSIIFSEEELVLALKPVVISKGHEKAGEPNDIVVGLNPDGDVQVVYKCADQDIVFETKELGVAVLNHCIEREIPLPRGSYKELAMRGDHVALIVRIEQ